MRDWKRWTAVLLAGSLAFTAADDMKLIVQAYEMQNEQGQESYQAESKSKLDDLKEKAVLFQEFQGEEQRFDGNVNMKTIAGLITKGFWGKIGTETVS